MAKICFINAYETSYLGTRVLASYMLSKGHEVHGILLESGEYLQIEEPLEGHEGYQSYSRGQLMVNRATKYKIGQEDTDLLARILQAEAPDVIGFSARSTNNWLIPVLVPVFKAAVPSALLAAGGFGPTLEPELYLDGGFHCVIRGDGEEALAGLMDCVEEEKRAQRPNMQKYSLCNTIWRYRGGDIKNRMNPQEKNLSKYGEALHGHKYFSFIKNGVMYRHYDPQVDGDTYFTYFGRGCIGHCTYCSGGQWSSLYKNEGVRVYKRRNREVSEVIEELKKMPEKPQHLWFVDEYFGLSREKTLEFCKLYKEHIGKTFFCYINYDYMLEHQDIFYKLVDSGLIGTGVGFQTGSEKFARDQYHRQLKNEHLLEFTKLCFDTNLFTGIHLIGGNCYETEEIFQDTVDLIRKLPFSIEDPWRMPLENIRLRPHPKTPITFLSPQVVTHPMSAKEWFYRGILWEFARILDKDEFENLRKETCWHEDPVKLNQHFKETLLNKQRQHFRRMIDDLHEKRLVFYGAGDLYTYNKEFFQDLNPEAFLIDKHYATPASIDGTPAYETDDFLQQNTDNDIFFLTFIRASPRPRVKLHHQFGIPNDRIHSCTSILK